MRSTGNPLFHGTNPVESRRSWPDAYEDLVLAALKNGVEAYRREYFREELRECQSTSQFDGLLDDLKEFHAILNIDTTRELETTQAAKEEFEENEAAYADHMQDEWKERNHESRADEASVRAMFGSLTSAR